MSWTEKASAVLRSHVPPGSRLLVAVSGGPDSVALAHFLLGQPYALVIGHIDHQLRVGSRADAHFVEDLARTWDVPCEVRRVNVRAHAKAHDLGAEEAARELRYQALVAMALKKRCNVIVAAHTANDQAETVMMNFLRGSGPAGLAGIPEVRSIHGSSTIRLLRPFLQVMRVQIMAYLSEHSLRYRTDPTNRSLRFSRNRMRHSTLPYLEKAAPGLMDRLLQSADVFRQEELFWEDRVAQKTRESTRKKGKRITVVLTTLLGYHKALSRRILRGVLPGLSFQDIEQVFTLARSPQRSAWLKLSGQWQVRREKNYLVALQKKRTG